MNKNKTNRERFFIVDDHSTTFYVERVNNQTIRIEQSKAIRLKIYHRIIQQQARPGYMYVMVSQYKPHGGYVYFELY